MSDVIKEIKFAFFLIFHPFKGFNDIKYEGGGSAKSACCIVLITILAFILDVRYTAFTFNTTSVDNFNILTVVSSVLIPFGLWCVSNWSLTTLMDGEGRFSEIVMATAYALLPISLVKIPLVIISYFTTIEDIGLMTAFSSIAMIWAIALILFGTMVVHQYSFGRTIFTALLILVGMAIIVFIFLLFFSLVQQMANFIIIVFKELSLRF